MGNRVADSMAAILPLPQIFMAGKLLTFQNLFCESASNINPKGPFVSVLLFHGGSLWAQGSSYLPATSTLVSSLVRRLEGEHSELVKHALLRDAFCFLTGLDITLAIKSSSSNSSSMNQDGVT